MLKISWKEKVSNTDSFEKYHRKRTTILQGKSTTETRLCWTCVIRGTGGRNALVIGLLEGKIKGKKQKVDRRL